MSAVDVLALVLALAFAVLGTTKVLAVAGMPERARHLGFTTSTYRWIGALELLAVLGLVAGLGWPLLGGAAAVGLIVLLTGAVASHVRRGDGARDLAAALVMVAIVGSYLLLATGAVR